MNVSPYSEKEVSIVMEYLCGECLRKVELKNVEGHHLAHEFEVVMRE